MKLFNRYSEKLLLRSQQALIEKRTADARRIANKALRLNKSLEEAWLILAASSKPKDSIPYLQKVLEMNPNNQKAEKGILWANTKIKEANDNHLEILTIDKETLAFIEKNKENERHVKSFFRQIASRWQTLAALICIMIIVIVAAAAPLLAPVADPEGSPWYKVVCERYHCVPEPPSGLYPLGTVKEFDVFHTLIWGVRQSLFFGLITASITALIGTLLGLVSAFYGGWFDRLIMRVCDAFMAFPIVAGVALFAQASVLMTASNTNLASNQITEANMIPNYFQAQLIKMDPILIALILFSWMGYTRIIHSQVLQVKKEEFIKAAHACGARNFRIIFKHILPNSITPSIVMATRDVGRMVVIQSSLTFIGVGGSSAWATLLNLGKDWIIGPGGNLLTRWWIYLPITLALVFFGFTWGIMGDELNHWMNPKNS